MQSQDLKVEESGKKKKKRDSSMRRTWPNVVNFNMGNDTMGLRMWEESRLEEAKKQILPWSLQKKFNPVETLILVP